MNRYEFARRISYISGAAGDYLDEFARRFGVGVMVQPNNSYLCRVDRYPFWAADNGVYSRKLGFDETRFRSMLDACGKSLDRRTCLFVVAPDVLHMLPDGDVMGDAAATLDKFQAWSTEVRSHDVPVALVAQNGLEDMLHQVPWDDLDTLFIGGSTEWKESRGARRCVEAAQAHRKRTHMGRVNSYRRLAIAQSWGMDTADGTFLAYAPHHNMGRLQRWLEKSGRAAAQMGLDL